MSDIGRGATGIARYAREMSLYEAMNKEASTRGWIYIPDRGVFEIERLVKEPWRHRIRVFLVGDGEYIVTPWSRAFYRQDRDALLKVLAQRGIKFKDTKDQPILNVFVHRERVKVFDDFQPPGYRVELTLTDDQRFKDEATLTVGGVVVAEMKFPAGG